MTYVISSCELVTNSGEVGVIFCTFERGGGGNHGGPSGTAFTRTALGFTGTYFSAMGDERPVYTLDEALSALRFGKYQALVLAYAGLGWVSEAMEIMILSFVGPAVKSKWKLTSSEESLLTTVVFAGMLLGAYSWGIISDNYGRRGTWMVALSAFWTAGTIFEASLAWVVMTRLNWRWLLAFSSVPSFALLLFYGLAPESPRYLCAKARTADAHRILEKMAFVNQTKLPPGILVSDKAIKENEESNLLRDTHMLSITRKITEKLKSGFSSFFMLFSRKLIRTTLLLWVLFFANVFSYYGAVLLTSKLSSGDSKCGSKVLHVDKSKDNSLYVDVFIASLAELPGLILSAIIVDKIGRKLSMVLMFVSACIFLLPLVFHQSAVVTTLLLFGVRMCVTGTITVATIYAPEIYPTPARTTGFGVASSLGKVGGMVCPLVAVGLVTSCHLRLAVILFEVVFVLAIASSLLFPFETMGRELKDTVDAIES
ncbi:Organic cation/carnitine transporter 7 [Citrus sinensis]|nr:Organic cation/carnitine transporter 7 [Citrus sinensis]